MFVSSRLCAALLVGCGLPLGCILAQTPQEDYERSHKVLQAHTQYGFDQDDSPEAVRATQQMWSAVADFVVALRTQDPGISADGINHALCLLTVEPEPPEAIQESAEAQCESRGGDASAVVELAPGLLLVAPAMGEDGTIFVLGQHEGKGTVLWSIADATPQQFDPHDLVGAWKTDRNGEACRAKGSPHKPGSCGPLYANVGVLPSDGKGRPRFYVDAGYEQSIGGTIGKQVSIWRWDGDRAVLQWINFFDFMIDQGNGTSFDEDKGILHVGEKGDFRTMYDCGSCIERPLDQRVLLTATGVQELGVRSLVPEMDAIDELFWRLSHGLPTSGIASPQASTLLRPQVVSATRESRKIDPAFYSVGMVSDVTQLTKAGAEVCLDADGLGTLNVRMRRTADGGYFIGHIAEMSGAAAECPIPAFGPPPSTAAVGVSGAIK